MVANAKTTSTTWSFPNSLEIWIRETNSAAFLHYLVFIWTKHCKAIGPPKKAITYIFVPSINNWFWRQLMSILPASCSLLSADAFGYFSRSSVWPLTFESTRTVPATNLLNFQPQVEKSPSARPSPAEYARIERPKYFHEESRAAISYCMRSMLILEVDRHHWHSADFPNYFRNIITSPSSFYPAFVCGEEKLSPLIPLLLDLILVDTRFNAHMVLQRFRVPLQSGCGVFWVTRWAQFFGPFSSVWPQCQLEIWKIAWNTTRWFLLTNLNHI